MLPGHLTLSAEPQREQRTKGHLISKTQRDMFYFPGRVTGRITDMLIGLKSSLRLIVAAVITSLGMCLASCRQSGLSSETLKPVIQDFVFVGTLRDPQQWPIGYRNAGIQLPSTFRVGTYYVFYRHSPNDPVDLGLKVLPTRLVDAGFRVLESPKSPIDFEQPEPGQARFLIVFEKSGHSGRIFNRYDLHLGGVEAHWKMWGSEAYVLVIDR
jgi:hypothetical protein